jgi:hypothetical protein
MFVPRIKNMQNPSWMEGPPTNMCALRALACSSMPVLENKAITGMSTQSMLLLLFPCYEGSTILATHCSGQAAKNKQI